MIKRGGDFFLVKQIARTCSLLMNAFRIAACKIVQQVDTNIETFSPKSKIKMYRNCFPWQYNVLPRTAAWVRGVCVQNKFTVP